MQVVSVARLYLCPERLPTVLPGAMWNFCIQDNRHLQIQEIKRPSESGSETATEVAKAP